MVGYGRRLVQLRGKKSQSEVAAAIGISISALGMYEKERRSPRDEIKIKLADYYQTTVGDLFFANECHVS